MTSYTMFYCNVRGGKLLNRKFNSFPHIFKEPIFGAP